MLDTVLISGDDVCSSVECAFTSPMRTECGMFVMYCMQCCMSVAADL